MSTEKLYNELMDLSNHAEGKFYYADHTSLLGEKFRVFSYHMASYSDWLLPSALESRGVMFLLDEDDNMVRIVSRPMEKFFNAFENPFTMDLDFTKTVQLMDKADGSLISTYLTGPNFALKSKTSIYSSQAVSANRYIKQEENLALWNFCDDCAKSNLTVNMEWCAPNNRIVLEYTEPKLIILNIRDNITGEYIKFDDIPQNVISGISKWLVSEYDPATAHDEGFYNKLRDMKGIEGMILRLSDGMHVKIKTQWYVDLHSHKDSVNVPKKLVKTILNNNHDDLYALFSDDAPTIERIREFESHVVKNLSASFDRVREHYMKNRHLDRKGFAVEGIRTLKPWEFGCAMQAYQAQTMAGVHKGLNMAFQKRPELLVPEKYLNEV